ncbi:MAG TPA: hypothetical protein VGF55_23715 [Gemmataceae bacterium]
MVGPLLSFHTPDGPQVAAWSATGAALLRAFAAALEARGFASDFEAGRGEQDWVFVASRGAESLAVVLVLFGLHPPSTRWFVGLEDAQFRPLDAPELRAEVQPLLEAVVTGWLGASSLRWHAGPGTLREA